FGSRALGQLGGRLLFWDRRRFRFGFLRRLSGSGRSGFRRIGFGSRALGRLNLFRLGFNLGRFVFGDVGARLQSWSRSTRRRSITGLRFTRLGARVWLRSLVRLWRGLALV